jgi:beta-RFAP synthase
MTTSDLAVRVRAPSRLHFGLLAFGDAAARQFGGVGVMIDRPETEVLVRFRQPGELPREPCSDAERRACEFADRFRESLDSREDRERISGLDIQVVGAATAHVGLGSGTQLGMSVARALAAFVGKSDLPPHELARRVGRGCRSAIGVYGFQLGGFIVEGGKSKQSIVSPLVARLSFPEDWQFVLVVPSDSLGRHGAAERDAFASLAPIQPAVTAELCRLTLLGILPAVAECDFQSFGESLIEFGAKVGECFSSIQGGVYASPLAGAVVDLCTRHGIRGVAQSSWGPTLAIVTDSRFRAEWIAARLRDGLPDGAAEILCTAANNLGAKTEVVELPAR